VAEPQDDPAGRLRVPPHSAEAEQAVLGGLLLDNRAWDRVGDVLEPRDFYAADHAAIYSTIGALVNASKPADVITVFERGGHDMAYLNQLASSVISASGARAYAEIVRERAQRRRLITIADNLASAAFKSAEQAPVPALVDGAVMALMDLAQAGVEGEPQPIDTLLPRFIDHINDLYEGRSNTVPTGLVDLDTVLGGGFRPGELVVIGARPSMGKTAFTLALCRSIGAQHPVLAMTMEDSLMSQVSRLVAAAGRVNLADLRNPRRAPESMWTGLTEGVDALAKTRIDLDETACMTLADVRRKIQQSRRRHGAPHGLVVVDYLQLMDGEGDNPNQVLGAVAKGLKRAAKELQVPIVLLSQLNREADKRSGPPQMSDLRDSGDIEGAADIIGLLYREFQRKPKPENKYHAELHLVKNKNGETRTLEFSFDGAYQRFGNWTSGGGDGAH
jgi:replicative DNA helicase